MFQTDSTKGPSHTLGRTSATLSEGSLRIRSISRSCPLFPGNSYSFRDRGPDQASLGPVGSDPGPYQTSLGQFGSDPGPDQASLGQVGPDPGPDWASLSKFGPDPRPDQASLGQIGQSCDRNRAPRSPARPDPLKRPCPLC